MNTPGRDVTENRNLDAGRRKRPQWKPGDRANGHILRLDGTWVRVARRPNWDMVALVAAVILVALVTIGVLLPTQAERCQQMLDVSTGYVESDEEFDLAGWTEDYRRMGCRQLAEEGTISARTPAR